MHGYPKIKCFSPIKCVSSIGFLSWFLFNHQHEQYEQNFGCANVSAYKLLLGLKKWVRILW
jgi:hypothetical protein